VKTEYSNTVDSEKIFSLSDSLEEREGVSPEYLQLQEALSQFRRLELTSDALVPKDFPSLATANEAVLQKRCLITAAKLVPRQESLRGSLKRLLAAMSGHAHLPESFLNWAEASGAELDDWFCASVKRDGLRLSEIAKTSQQDSELLLWTGRELAKPFFQRYSRTRREFAELESGRVSVLRGTAEDCAVRKGNRTAVSVVRALCDRVAFQPYSMSVLRQCGRETTRQSRTRRMGNLSHCRLRTVQRLSSYHRRTQTPGRDGC